MLKMLMNSSVSLIRHESLAETSIADDDSDGLKVVAVTSCPTGIAHTYMAAEGLEKAANKAGIKIKIET